MDQPVRVTVVHDAAPDWRWIAPSYAGSPPVEWRFVSTQRGRLTQRLPGPHLGRVRAGLAVRAILATHGADLVISQGPYTSYYVEALGVRGRGDVPHLAMTFNFTDIPSGQRLRAMRRAFARIDRFVVFSTVERTLYAETFGLPVERFVFVPWGVAPPITAPVPRIMGGPYVAALGGEARDYATLLDAARRLPQVRFVLVVRPNSLAGLAVPDNVTVHVNLPFVEAWSIVWHAAAAIVPLRSATTPNGHVTLVGGMHLGKAQVITDSSGIRDYVREGETALLVPAHDGAAMASAITRLLDDPALAMRLGDTAQAFARAHCSEAATVAAVRRQIAELTSRSG